MPLTELQARVLRVIAANRSPDSYLAGATVLNRDDQTPRYSQDLDLFHDLATSVAACAEADAVTLAAGGYELRWLLRTPVFYRGVLAAGSERLAIEWAQDSAFRFFPTAKDVQCGYCLHWADAAVNKALALAGRHEIRDLVDVLHLHEHRLHLGALAWAACGKDPGFTPAFLLEQAARHTAYTQADLDRLSLRSPLDLQVLKRTWLEALAEAQRLVEELPPADLGCLYLDAAGTPRTPGPSVRGDAALTRHFGCVRGAWPTVGLA